MAGILSSLMKIAGIAAAPFSGGASLALTGGGGLLDKMGKAGQVMGGQQSGANNARVAQGHLNLGHDRNALDRYGIEQSAQNTAGQLDLQRQQFGTQNRSATAKQALIGMLLGGGGMQATKVGPNERSGGLLASLMANPEALAALKTMGSQASAAQNTPLQFAGGQMVAPPKLSDVPKIDVGGGKLGTLGKILQIGGAFGRGEDEAD